MRNARRLLAALLAVVMLIPSILVPGYAAETTGFKDVREDSWYADAVDYVSAAGYMKGTSKDAFSPGEDVTRAMFVTILSRVARAQTDNTASAFGDVAANQYYSGAIDWAAEKGIVNGVGGGLFAPYRSITRQDLAVMLYRFVNAMGYELSAGESRTYTDEAKISAYAADAVQFVTSTGLFAGYQDGSFRPKATATRAQTAVIVMRLAQLLDGQIVDPEPMPAQSFNGAAGDDMSVAVNAPVGALPENTNMTVSRVTDEASLADIAEKINGKVYAAADITFSKDGAELEPEKNVEVQISLDGLENLKNPTVYHLRSDNTVEIVSSELVSVNRAANDKALRFYVKDFSVYIIGDVSETKLLTVEFRNKDNAIISVQALRISTLNNAAYVTEGKDYIYDPGVPAITETQSFEGWADKQNYSETDHGYSVEEINKFIKDNSQTYIGNDENVTLTYYAKVYDVRYVVYHDQAGSVLMSQAFHVQVNNGTVSTETVEINWPYVGFKGGQNFAGWVTDAAIQKDNDDLLLGDYPLYKDNVGTIYLNEHEYELSATLQLYPYLNSGNWLIFDTYKDQTPNDSTSTTFISPDFYEEGENTVAPEVPVRVGYEFKGWFKDKQFQTPFVFGSPINEDTTVYAKWEAKNTTYRIAVWQQLSTDTVDNNNLNNEYAYYAPTTVEVLLTAKTGTQVSLADAYKQLGDLNGSTSQWGEMGYYFVFNEARSNQDNNGGTVTVKGNGSTVLNAYYDRKLITINFWTSSSMSTLWTGGGNVYVPAENGQYYYYENPTPTGYYLAGTGPKANQTPQQLNTLWYGAYYTSLNGNSVPLYHADTTENGETVLVSQDYSSSYDYQQSTEGYWYERYYNSGYRYYPQYYYYQSTSSYSTGYYQVGTGPNPTAAGTHNLQAFSNPMVGLYQAPLYGWPEEPSGYEWEYDDAENGNHYGITFRDCFDIPDNTHTTTWNIYRESVSGTINSTIHWMCEKLDGTFEEVTTNKIKTTTTQYYDHGKFLGFQALGHNLTTNSTSASNGFVAYQKDVGIKGENFGSNGAYIFYVRRQYDFIYMSNNAAVKTEHNVKYQADMSGFANYEPTNGQEGYFFDGWYADPGCTVEFDFNDTMPNNQVTVYAKWTQMRFRVVVDPRGGDTSINPTDIVIPNGQATTFRINYGEAVEGTNFNEATRTGYTLLGWYLDTDPTNDTVFDTPFTFATPMTDHGGMADMNYQNASDAKRQGTDPWKDNAAYSDVGISNVVGKITIYGKWRQNPDGVVGINVHYEATDKNGNTGKFSDNSTAWDDPNIYADKAMAFGQPASTPDDNTLQFLYWEILDANNNVVGKAYPGQLWEIDINNAKVTDLTAQAIYVTAPEAETEPEAPEANVVPAPAAPAAVPAPAAETEDTVEDEVPARGDTRAAHTYHAVTQPTPGRKYLITVTVDTVALVMTPSYYSGSARPSGTVVSVSDSTITGDYDDYLFGVEYYNDKGYVFGNLNRITYLSMQTSSNYYPYYGIDSNNPDYTYWTYNTSTKTLQNRGYTSRYLYYNYDDNNNFYWTTNTSGDAITFYELVEDEITTGTDFYRVEELKVGDKVAIAHDDLAVGNTVFDSTNNRRLNPVRVGHTVSGDEHITVAAGDANAVLWEVVSGDATNGFVLKNVANNQYLDLDSSGYVTLSSSSSGVATWKYEGTDLSTTKSSRYPYLKLSNEFVNFDTSNTGNRDIRLYVATRKYNVTFMDGYNNTQIGAVQQVNEGEAAVAPTAPDHTAQGYIFTGWDKNFDNVTEDLTVTAQYKSVSELNYTVTFRYMKTDGTWDEMKQTVQHGQSADDPRNSLPTPPTGYTFNSWDKRFNNITSNLTVNAVYKMIPTKKYTVNLRAVYGLKTTEAKTHINWYANDGGEANNGAGDCYAQTRVEINKPVAIPTPDTWTADTWVYGTPELLNPTGLSWPGHTFLGWARVDTETGSDQKAHPELATEADCWLIWHEDETVSGGGYYTVNLDKDPEYEAAGGTADKHEANVAADEMRPYHDMYAVWSKPAVYYVYHSATGILEAIDLNAVRGPNNDGTDNLVNRVTKGYLYGGYYSDFGGLAHFTENDVTKSIADLVAESYNNVAKYSFGENTAQSWDAATAVQAQNKVLATFDLKTNSAKTGYQEYTGQSLKVNNVPFWVYENAYQPEKGASAAQQAAVNGETMIPREGAVYYLKEVPPAFLPNRLVYVKADENTSLYDGTKVEKGEITSLYLLTAVDDMNYAENGFDVGNSREGQVVTDPDTGYISSADTVSRVFTIFFKGEGKYPRHYNALALNRDIGVPQGVVNENLVGFVAAKHLDYDWIQDHTGFTSDKSTFYLKPYWTTLDGVKVTQNIKGVNITTDGKDIQYVNIPNP